MRDSYSKRLNILFHGAEETVGSNETKEQTKTAFEILLKDAFELESDAIEIVDVHRLLQYPIKKQGKFVVIPIIAKVLTTFDKDLIFKNISKLKEYNENRGSEIFVTDHLPQLFYKQKKYHMSQFKQAQRREKETERWGVYDGQYCLYIGNKRILFPDCL